MEPGYILTVNGVLEKILGVINMNTLNLHAVYKVIVYPKIHEFNSKTGEFL